MVSQHYTVFFVCTVLLLLLVHYNRLNNQGLSILSAQ